MTTFRQTARFALGFTVGLLWATQAHSANITASDAASLYGDQTTYTISRNGKKVGQHILSFETDNNKIEVAVDSKITITILKIPVFKFRYLSTETWEDDRLVASQSTTTTDGDIETATLKNSGDNSLLGNNDGEQTTARIEYATNHWNQSVIEMNQLFNTVKGVKSEVMVNKIGNETLDISGMQVETTHYAYTGDIEAQTWYDENKRWVKLAFLGTDGSKITYLIDNP